MLPFLWCTALLRDCSMASHYTAGFLLMWPRGPGQRIHTLGGDRAQMQIEVGVKLPPLRMIWGASVACHLPLHVMLILSHSQPELLCHH